MRLSELLSGIHPVSLPPLAELEISGLSEDSREVGPGFLFFARQGARAAGADFARQAVARGAVVVLSEREMPDPGVPVLVLPSMAEAQARIADRFYGHPSRELTLIGVTGTNGKTTITYLLESIAAEMGWRAGVIGTISYRLPGQRPG